ncbi:MAG: glycosyltransferase [Bacteroides sp.]|nr:glycosyltransferase [Bacteroides sp.]
MKEKKFDISVVLGAKNRKNLIQATIESIRNNGFRGSLEIIVIDGGSKDGTCDWLARQKDIFTIIQPNYSVIGEGGYSVRAHSWGEFMNIGFKYAHSDYICMVSDDLILAPGCLQTGYDEICKRQKEGERIGGGAFYFREFPRHDYYRVINLPQNFININHGFYYKPALEDVGYLDESSYNFYCGDGDISMRLNLAGWKTISLNNCFALHLVHLPQRKKAIPKWVEEDMAVFNKKYGETSPSNSITKCKYKFNIDSTPFWKHATKNVIAGYLLKLYDKRSSK